MGASGFNIRVNIWRISTVTGDDVVGGAITTGTVVYSGVMARLEQEPASQLLLQQGLETLHTYRMNIIPGTLTVYERDEIELVKPEDHHYYGQIFRVMGVMYSSHNPRDPRNYIMLTLTRSDRMHHPK